MVFLAGANRGTAFSCCSVFAPQDFADTVAMGGDAPFVVWVWVGSTRRASLVAWFKPLFEQIVAMVESGNRLIEIR